jgi:hypothetical protein
MLPLAAPLGDLLLSKYLPETEYDERYYESP